MLSTKLFLSKIFLKREQSNCFFRGADRPGVHSLCWPSQLADSVDLLSEFLDESEVFYEASPINALKSTILVYSCALIWLDYRNLVWTNNYFYNGWLVHFSNLGSGTWCYSLRLTEDGARTPKLVLVWDSCVIIVVFRNIQKTNKSILGYLSLAGSAAST